MKVIDYIFASSKSLKINCGHLLAVPETSLFGENEANAAIAEEAVMDKFAEGRGAGSVPNAPFSV